MREVATLQARHMHAEDKHTSRDAYCHSSVRVGPEPDACMGPPSRLLLGSIAGALCNLAAGEIQPQGLHAMPCQGTARPATYLEHEIGDHLHGQQAHKLSIM